MCFWLSHELRMFWKLLGLCKRWHLRTNVDITKQKRWYGCISKCIYYKSIENKCVNAIEKLKEFQVRYVNCVIVVDTHMDLS